MKHPKVSICIPVFNTEKYVRRCIESLQNQTEKDIEIIIINDCTPDNAMVVVQEMASKDDRIKILNHEHNKGTMCARETGYLAAKGEYITFCDSDDSMPLDAIETLYSEALRTGSDIISGNGVFVPIKGEQTIMEGKLPYGNDKSGVYKALLKRDLRQSLWGKLFKASLFTDYQYKNYEHFTNGEDGLLLYQVVRNISSFSLIDAPVYNYMQNAASSSQKRYKKNAIKGICAINRARHDLVKDYPELETDVNKCVTNVLCSLYSQRYDRDANLNDFLEEYGLKKYISLSNVFKYLQAKVIMKYAIRYLRNTF